MLKHIVMAGVCSSLIFSSATQATAGSASSPDEHAPIGVMADHAHKKGEWMLSYRYGRMDMDGNRDGTSGISTSEVLSNYMVAPLEMSMDMHMFGAMYGVNDKLTIMGMLPYLDKSMTHITRMGMRFKTATEGVGDAKISGLYTLYQSSDATHHHRSAHTVLLNFGASLPTGSITERGNTPAGANLKLPYPMQLGSGTIDPILGITYTNAHDNWSWGSQVNTILRFGKNNEGYRLGHEYSATAWMARNVTDFASISFRLDGKHWGDIHGRDRDLNPMMVPTARTDLRGGKRIDALVGINLYQPDGVLAGHRLAAEFGLPVYQHLDGPQLETDYRFILGWQKAF